MKRGKRNKIFNKNGVRFTATFTFDAKNSDFTLIANEGNIAIVVTMETPEVRRAGTYNTREIKRENAFKISVLKRRFIRIF